jgi:hypothetical protein
MLKAVVLGGLQHHPVADLLAILLGEIQQLNAGTILRVGGPNGANAYGNGGGSAIER